MLLLLLCQFILFVVVWMSAVADVGEVVNDCDVAWFGCYRYIGGGVCY